jgi:prepilin-type processing-associated H-X9-DG protein
MRKKPGERNLKIGKSMRSKFFRFACWGILVGLVWIGLEPISSRSREVTPRMACARNLSQMGLVHKMYANESEGHYLPALSDADNLIFPLPEVYPEYLADSRVLICPEVTKKVGKEPSPAEDYANRGYVYFGYALGNEEEMLAFLESYPAFMKEGADFSKDLPAQPGRGSFGGDIFVRLREDLLEDFPEVDLSALPVMMDARRIHPYRKYPKKKLGYNVLYMDGHVEYHKYPGGFPATEGIAAALHAVLD